MPMIVLVVFSSFAGAVGVVAGLMLLVGSLNSADFTQGSFTDAVQDGWGWYLMLLVLALGGIVVPGQAGGRDASHHRGSLVRRESLTVRTGPLSRTVSGLLEGQGFRAANGPSAPKASAAKRSPMRRWVAASGWSWSGSGSSAKSASP